MSSPVSPPEEVAVVAAPPRVVLGETADALRAAFDAAFELGARSVLVDVSGCAYMDSSGIGELLAGMRRAREAGGRLAIVGPPGKVQEILEITKLARLFVIAADEAAARAALRGA